MRLLILSFALGIALCQLQTDLMPGWSWLLTAILLALMACLLRNRAQPWCRIGQIVFCLSALMLGLAWANWRAELRLADRLAERLEGQDIRLTGSIAGLPQRFERGQRFYLDVVAAPEGVPRRLMLSWYKPERGTSPAPDLRAGERWQLELRLRQPHGSINPHGFDYEAWLLEQGVGAVGYVRPGSVNQRLSGLDQGLMSRVDRLREQIRSRFERVLPDAPWRGVLVALVVGDQAGIGQAQWSLFRQTGVTHLMSISGLHVTLIGALVAWVVSTFWRRWPGLMLRLPAQKAAVLGGAMAAGGYVLLAGCGVPAQRTFYMLAVAALALWLGRTAGASRVMALALLLVLLIDPWAVLSAGFWLSFGAVAALMLFACASQGDSGRWTWFKDWLRAQWAVTLFSLPLLLGLFQQFSLISPLANALAIPLVSAVITPLALGFAVLPLPSLAELAHWLLDGLMRFLVWCAESPFAMWQQAAPPMWLVLACVLAVAWALLPRGVPARWTGLLSIVPLLCWTPLRPPSGALDMTVLDVGQGLAVHLRTAEHDLLFDAGPQYSPETDAGERVVLPYLRAEGVSRLDMLVISHDDADHSGGADSVLAGFPVKALRSSMPGTHPLLAMGASHAPCEQGRRWIWDEVSFEFLHPATGFSGDDNERSCVLQIKSKGGTVLLTGDVGARAERSLLTLLPERLQSDVMIAPHHGSRSSSTPAFVDAVSPGHVVFTAGYRNRYHHPAPEVLARYAGNGARLYRSDGDGAVRFRLREGHIEVTKARVAQARYWHDRTY